MLRADPTPGGPTLGVWRRTSRVGIAVMAMVTTVGVGVVSTPQAPADPAANLAEAMVSARSAAPCGPLRYDPIAEHAAEVINRSTVGYLNHTARNVPADEPHPMAILKDLGSEAGKVLSLQGAGQNDVDAIKGVLLEGHDAIPDCSYDHFGVSLIHDAETGYRLAVVVLAGM